VNRYFLLGPTASGKTAIALLAAPALDAEIVSMDSMLVYRGMDLGTAKPSAAEQAQIPHHLIDLIAPHEDFSVAKYLQATEVVERDLAARGKNALYVGGTNLYLKALTAGLLEVPEASAGLRQQLRAEWDADGGPVRVREELQKVDPHLVDKVHPNDAQRLLRGLEVYRTTGQSLSEWQLQWTDRSGLEEPAVALNWPREVLRERVEVRFDQMMEMGFVGEIQSILEDGGFSRTAAKALGYRQMLDHLNGSSTQEAARQSAITLTRTYIRRQMTWLRSFSDLQWVEMADGKQPRAVDQVAAEVVDRLRGGVPATPKSSSEEHSHD
jgi:tRNA dimethylallyltransferase